MRSRVPLVLFVLLLLTIAGAWSLSFLCDDAYITFRYVSNARDGHGLVWNPPPFLPVEGYSCFLWALLLWATWSWFGVEPPDAANVLSILCGVGQFAVIAYAAFQVRRRDGARVGASLALATVLCIVGQRTFLQWMTSGLETALFNLGFVSWALLAFRGPEQRTTRWLWWWSLAAAVAALTRPDGLLLVAVTAAVAVPGLGGVGRRLPRAAVGLLPLLLVAAHVLWRKWFYGEWLPNTYYAKVVKPWPEAGVLYWKCFLFEHGLWLWFPVALVWVVVWLVRHRADLLATARRCLPALAVVAAIAYHTGYYILIVGGDHFEYRVLSQLVPLAWLSLLAMGVQLVARTGAVLLLLGTTLLASAVGWVHLAISQGMAKNGIFPLAHKLPAAVRPLWRWHDSMQIFLHVHFVCLRANQHAIARDEFVAKYPPRGFFARSTDDVPVLIEGVVGVASWVLRDIAIIDRLGLNDWVVARTPFGDWRSLPQVPQFEQLLVAADTDGDGRLKRPELLRWFESFYVTERTTETDAATDALIDMAFDLYGDGDSLATKDTPAFMRGIFSRGAMAHERMPPAGYTEAFEANVLTSPERVEITPRAVPLRARIPAIEAEWRAKGRRGELKV